MKTRLLLPFLLFLAIVPFSLFSQTVAFSTERGVFTTSFQLTLTSSIGGSVLYTTNGTAPSSSTGTVYSGPITINNTTVVRAVAVNNATVTPIATNTYLFLDSVIKQPATIAGWPNNTYDLGANGATAVHDYQMDPKVVNDPAYSSSIINAMKDIPTLSIVMDKGDFWSMYDGDAEFATSVELINPKNPAANEQFNCGIKSHSWLRLKRSMALVINNSYFPSSLTSNLFKNAPLNGANATNKFTKTQIVLGAGNNRSWARNWNPDRTCYTRDQWYRDALIDVSGVGSHGTYVHLYVNGLYWGLYNPVERLDAGQESANLGGTFDDWMSLADDGVRSGDTIRYGYLTGPLISKDMTVPANYTELKSYLDVANFSDYLLTTWMTGMSDWPVHNYGGGNRNNPPGPFLTYGWDCEWSWDVTNGSNNGAWVHPAFRNDQAGVGLLTNIWHSVRRNKDFMMLFADRVYRSCFNNGGLTDSVSRARWQTLNNFISNAIIGESARWGDAVGDGITRTKNNYWQPEVTRVDSLMNGNVQRFIAALIAQGYYPSINPPYFSREGGVTTPGYQLTLTNPNTSGAVYYTIDGTDPRLPGGSLSSSALVYSSPIAITSTLTIKARVFDGSSWSALHEGYYLSPGSIPLKINEFLASNVATIKDEFGGNDDWFEVYNSGSQPIDLGGMYVTNKLATPKKWQIPTTNPTLTTVPAHGYKLIWADKETAQGPLHVNFNLSKSGDSIGLVVMDGLNPVYVDSLSFGLQGSDTSTGRYPDGSATFKPFIVPTPGSANIITTTKDLFINEFLASNSSGTTDEFGEHNGWIEIYNKNTQPLNIGGFYITNNLANPQLYQIPSNQPAVTTIPANGFIVLWADNQVGQGALHLGFTLNVSGGEIGLVDKSGATAGFIDSLHYTVQSDNISSARYPDASVNFKSFTSPTPGAYNTLPLVTGLFINEFMASNAATITDEGGKYDDWYEVYNSNTKPVDIGGLFVTDNIANPRQWQIPTSRPDLTTIPAKGFKLLWADQETAQGVLHTNFKLSASGEQLALVQVNGSTITFIDSLSFGSQKTDTSVGRYPNGSAAIVTLNHATPGASNDTIPAGPRISSFTLINATNNQDIQTINDGAILNLATLPTKSLNVRANALPATVGSVVFNLSGIQSKTQTETVAPYALFGDNNGIFIAWTPAIGSYTLKAVPYQSAGGSGTAGTSLTVNFKIIDSGSSTKNVIPIANAGVAQSVTLPANSAVLDGSASNDPDGVITSYSWTETSGPGTATFSPNSNSQKPTINGLIAGTYVFRLVVTDNSGALSNPATVSVTVSGTATTGTPVYRINAGGPQVTNSIGTFAADAYYSPAPGNIYSTTTQIAGTANGAMYQTERYGTNGTFSYAFPVSNGSYSVILHFAELYWSAAGKRLFDVSIEGNKVLDNYDIFKKAGAFTATSETFPVNVTDGTLNLYFSSLAVDGGLDQPKVSAIEIVNNSTGTTNTIPVANAGSAQSVTLPANSIVLDGSASKDPDGTIVSYSWTETSGPSVVTFSPNSTVQKPAVNGLVAGTYVFKLVVTDNSGALSNPATVSVTVSGSPNAQFVSSFTLINAANNQPIQTLTNGATLNLATLPSRSLNIRANTSPATVGSVVFSLGGTQTRSQTETAAPYALFGDNNGVFLPWTPAAGSYSLSATPYTSSGGSGTSGTPLSINFTVINQSSAIVARKAATTVQPATAKPEIVSFKAYPNPNSNGHYNVLLPEPLQGQLSYILTSATGTRLAGGMLLLTRPTSLLTFNFSTAMISSGQYFLTLEGKELKGQVKLMRLK